jgi:radical SAM superfamily enzyme YgiQ (UPF0313 family)
MCGAAHEAGVPVVVNSSDASDHVFEYIGHGADFVLLGEVERTLGELSLALSRGCLDPAQIPGVAYRNHERKVKLNRRREESVDLDQLPGPAWDLVDIAAYRGAWTSAHGFFSLNMVSSRGCPYRCNWCAKPLYGNNYHVRSARLLAEEMHHLKRAFAPDQIWFADDIFALSARWTREFADAVDALDAHIPFKMQSRCDLMTRDTVADLARAGCGEVWMGVESGSQKILDAMEKDLRVEDVHRARQNLRAHGIRACYFLQFGYPGEDWDDIQSTIQMVRETRPDEIGVSVAYPLPGTKFYKLVEAQLGPKKNWQHSDDLSMMFRGSYTSEFYRALRDALHLEVAGGDPVAIEESWRRLESLRSRSASPKPTLIEFGVRG